MDSDSSFIESLASHAIDFDHPLGKLSDGRSLKFEDISNFDGHVKIYPLNEGPEYGVILGSGNIGGKAWAEFDPDRLTICG
ncbi:MAG: hypothetical protein O2829_04190 [Bacteroidetes bacterium]|nr:hypothetical protein [Bacteroidota bacterium]MDA1268274.1 hypothetical protein [Bacteroidota bacterium]